MDIIERLNRIPEKYYQDLLKFLNEDGIVNYYSKNNYIPLMIEFDEYQLHVTHDEYPILKNELKNINRDKKLEEIFMSKKTITKKIFDFFIN